MLNLLNAEFYKLKTSKRFYSLLGLMVIQSILCPIIFSGSMTGKEVLLNVFGAQQFIGLMIVTGVFSGYFIADEFESTYIKNFIAYGHKKRDIVIAKSIVYYFGITVINLISPILITIINTVMNGYGEEFTMESFMFILRIGLFMSLIYIGIASIALLIAFICRKALITVGAFIFILDPINRFGSAFSLRKESVRIIYEKTVFGHHLLALSDNITFSKGMQIVLICLATILFSTVISIYAFKKADVK